MVLVSLQVIHFPSYNTVKFKIINMIFYLFLTTLIVSQVNSDTICEIRDCKCDGNLTTAKCLFLQGVPEIQLPNTIKSIDLSKNNLTNINPLNSTVLEKLRLNNNNIHDLKLGTFNLPELKSLDLSNNKLEKLHPDLFKNVIKLETLLLANNKLSITSQLNFSLLMNLKRVNLDNNFIGPDIELRSLFKPNGFGLPATIQSISLSGTNLTDLPYNFFNPVKNTLKELTISNNGVTKIFKLPSSLEYFDVSYNPIKKLNYSDFPYDNPLVNLRVLKLNGLEIREVPKNIFHSLFLYNLELANNKNLNEFSNLTFGRQVLTDSYDFLIRNLTLKGSNLSTIDEGLSVLFKRIERLDLQNNPWYCDCNVAWIRNLNVSADFTENLRCLYPRKLYNMKLFDVTPSDFVCPDAELGLWSYETGVIVGAVLYSILTACILFWIYKYLHRPISAERQEYAPLL